MLYISASLLKKDISCFSGDYHEYFRLLQYSWRNESMKSIDEMINRGVLSDRDKKVMFRISCDMPYKEEVIKQLKKKDLYVGNQIDSQFALIRY